jgi:hypothetical protein
MSGQAYVGATQRTFRSAVLHELETQYGLLGSQRVLSLLAEDIERLVRAFFPTPEHLQSGWMIYTGVRASGPKATPGQSATARELVTLAWPVLLAEDNGSIRKSVCEVIFTSAPRSMSSGPIQQTPDRSRADRGRRPCP